MERMKIFLHTVCNIEWMNIFFYFAHGSYIELINTICSLDTTRNYIYGSEI